MEEYFNLTVEELKKIKILNVERCKEYNAQKITCDFMYFNRLEIIRRSSDGEKFIVIEENRSEKFYIVIPFNISRTLNINDLVTCNMLLM